MRTIFLALLSVNIAHATLSSCPQNSAQAAGCDVVDSQFNFMSSATNGDGLASLITETQASTTLYTTGGTPPDFDNQPVNAWDIKPSSIQAVAVQFDPSVTASFGQIEVPIDSVSGTGSVVVDLLSDSGGKPGSVIESWTPAVTSSVAMITLSSVSHPTLTHGTNYWVEVTTTGSLEANWYIATSNLRGADLMIGGPWFDSTGSSTPSLAVLSEESPEPSTAILTLAGLLAALAGAALRKGRLVR